MPISQEAIDASIKLMLALVLAGLLGLERERRGRAAGFRTHIIVCLGSTLAMMASIKLSDDWFAHGSSVPFDRGRIAAGILQGIGFIGAGAIINVGNIHRGITTAAMVWFVGVLGIAIGLGYFTIAVTATVFALIVVLLFEGISERVAGPLECRVGLEIDAAPSTVNDIKQYIESLGYTAQVAKVDTAAHDPCIRVEYQVNGKPKSRLDILVQELQKKFEAAKKVTVTRR